MRNLLTLAALLFTATTATADTQRGIEFYNAENYKAAEQEFLAPVNAGDPTAIRYYANMLYTGRGIPTDRNRAKQLLRDAYAAGDTASGTYLAGLLSEFFLHFSGDETEIEKTARLREATKLFEETYTGPTQQEPATNIVNSFVSSEGQVVPKEPIILWFKRAVREGHADSAWYLATAYSNGNGVKQDAHDAYYWAEFAAFLGHTDAQYTVGQLYAEGRYGPIRQDEGMALIIQAAKEQHNPSMLLVAEHFASQGSNHDLGMAWRVLHLGYDRGMEKSERSQRLTDFLLSRNANQYAKPIKDFMYNGHFQSLIDATEPDYRRAKNDFNKRIRAHSE
jgi:TPR repeat protein